MEENIKKINEETAYIKGNPIYNPEQMTEKLSWDSMDEDWIINLKDKFWCTQYKGDIRKELSIARPEMKQRAIIMEQMLNLRDKVLLFGGQEVCMPFLNETVRAIIDRGQLWYGDEAVMKKGLPSQCHYNSAKLWEKYKEKFKIVTGYALSLDGMWREHSWCVEVRPRKNRIVETTEPRVAYYGMTLTDDESEEFLTEADN